jgi:hypothetical protein
MQRGRVHAASAAAGGGSRAVGLDGAEKGGDGVGWDGMGVARNSSQWHSLARGHVPVCIDTLVRVLVLVWCGGVR